LANFVLFGKMPFKEPGFWQNTVSANHHAYTVLANRRSANRRLVKRRSVNRQDTKILPSGAVGCEIKSRQGKGW
jgi:hypothetical protein